MNDIASLALPVNSLCRLLQYVDAHPNAASAGEIAALAIDEWLARDAADQTRRIRRRGYQWKTVFLPEGTQLRAWNRTGFAYAEVIGDAIIYLGEPVSPHAFICRCKGISRSAWAEVALLFPDDDQWKRADAHRRDLDRQPVQRSSCTPTAAPLQPVQTSSGFPAVPPGDAAEKPLASHLRLPRVLPIPTQARQEPTSHASLAGELEKFSTDRRQGYRRCEDLLMD